MIKNKNDFTPDNLSEVLFQIANASYPNGSPWSKAQWEADLELAHSFYFIEEQNDEIVGFLACHLVVDEIEIMQVAVHPAQQKQGIAQQLLKQLASFAHEKVAISIFLEVRESNQAAKQAYRKSGFEEIGIRKKYYHAPVEDAVLMLKKVR